MAGLTSGTGESWIRSFDLQYDWMIFAAVWAIFPYLIGFFCEILDVPESSLEIEVLWLSDDRLYLDPASGAGVSILGGS